MLENSSTEKVTTRCLYCITSLVLYKQKLSTLVQTSSTRGQLYSDTVPYKACE